MKLLDFLAAELEDWERGLDEGKRPDLKDLSRLIETGRQLHAVLRRNGWVEPTGS